jgi:hypothetical protein
MNLGIDKIQLHTKEYSIDSADSNLFGFNTSTKQGESEIPILLVDKQGVYIQAKSIYRNTPLANYTINKFGLQVQFNPSVQYHPYNLLTPESKRFSSIIEKVKQELDAAGIQCCLDSAQLTRFDVANQQDMYLTPTAYNQVFALLKGKRATNQREYPGGYLFGNRSWQIIGYDKILALMEKKTAFDGSKERKLLRIEYRALTSKTINRTLPFRTITDLRKVDAAGLKQVYSQELQKKLFTRLQIGEQQVLDFNQQTDILRELLQTYGSMKTAVFAHLNTISGVGVEDGLTQFGGLLEYRKFLRDSGLLKKRYSYVITALIEQLIADRTRYSTKGKTSLSTLVDEVYTKFAV